MPFSRIIKDTCCSIRPFLRRSIKICSAKEWRYTAETGEGPCASCTPEFRTASPPLLFFKCDMSGEKVHSSHSLVKFFSWILVLWYKDRLIHLFTTFKKAFKPFHILCLLCYGLCADSVVLTGYKVAKYGHCLKASDLFFFNRKIVCKKKNIFCYLEPPTDTFCWG
jgi:hypothetical protein